MATEYEAKILEIDPLEIEKRILASGGRAQGSILQRRYVYDIEPGDQSRWLRLRSGLYGVTLCAKHIRHDGIDGTDEVEIEVEDFEKTHELLGMLGFTAKAYQENRRTSYELDQAQVEIDQWPQIPAYMEIEGMDREHVIEVAALLGYRRTDLTGENTTKIYERYGIDLASISDLRF